jgi:predicted phosphodiesterase
VSIRLAVIADIHGNLPALEAVLADIDCQGVDGIIAAGDYISGPRNQEVIDLLRRRARWMILGNHEERLNAYHRGTAPALWRAAKQMAPLRWCHAHLDAETRTFVGRLPQQATILFRGVAPIRVIHGSLDSASEGLLPERNPEAIRRALREIDEQVLVCAHYHWPWAWRVDGKLALNPGSAGNSLTGDTRAYYALLTWRGEHWQVEHRPVAYSLARLRDDFVSTGFLAEGGALARVFLRSTELARIVAGPFLRHAHRLARQAGYPPTDLVPDDVWDEAVATFDWDACGGRVRQRRGIART